MSQEDWPKLSVAEVLDGGIPPYPETELPGFTEVAVASWRMGDYGAAMWLYWDPDDLSLPLTHDIEVARWEQGGWRPLTDRIYGSVPGGLTWRPTVPVE